VKRRVAFYASVSFGKDSLAMLLLLLEKKMPLDEVIFYNSEMEFQAIYDIRDRIKPVLEQRGIRFTEVKPGVPFLYNMLDRPVDSKKNGFHLGYGWCGGPCRWGTKLKTRTLDGVALDADVHYVGHRRGRAGAAGKAGGPQVFAPGRSGDDGGGLSGILL